MVDAARQRRAAEEGIRGVHRERSVEVIDPDGRLGPPDNRGWLSDRVREALRLLGAAGEVRIRVVGDAAMAAAHGRYKGEPQTTDVLTFDLSDGPGNPLDVDLLICADEAGRQAAARGHGPERELLLYSIHGLLHCLGHDDHDPARAAAMHAEEDRILEQLGVGATFARPEGGTAGGGGGR